MDYRRATFEQLVLGAGQANEKENETDEKIMRMCPSIAPPAQPLARRNRRDTPDGPVSHRNKSGDT